MKPTLIQNITSAVLAGIMISIGGTVNLSCDNRYIGSFLFGFGLFMIICNKFSLFTGKVGYIPLNKPKYVIETLIALIGNCIGVFIPAMLLKLTRLGSVLSESSVIIIERKLGDSLLSSFILAIFCGMLMYLAVESNRLFTLNQNYIGSALSVFLPVIIFIISGFNHCIADMYYIFLSGIKTGAAPYFMVVIIGNAIGGVLISLLQKLNLLPKQSSN